jgi:hypothetical protein
LATWVAARYDSSKLISASSCTNFY